MSISVINLTPDLSGYPYVARALMEEPLRSQWRADAESEHEDGISYVMVLDDDGTGRRHVPAAWAGYRIEDGVLRCCNNYVRHGFRDRDPELYEVAYRARHDLVVAGCGLPAVTYLFPEPIPLHLADGWELDTTPEGSGISRDIPGVEHHWRRLTRAAV